MKQSKKKPTTSQVDTSMLMTGEELNLVNAVCARLIDAKDAAQRNIGDLCLEKDFNPQICPALPLQALSTGNNTELKNVIVDMHAALKAAYRGGNPAKLLSHWLCFVYQGAIPLLQKKHSIALADGNHVAAQTFSTVFNALPPCDKIDHPKDWTDIEAEAQRLAQSTTPDEIYVAICGAFRMDAEATNEINNGNSNGTAPENTNNKPYDRDLNPERSKADARDYMAGLVCYVWCEIPKCKSKTSACDYVFQSAKDGDRLYGDCIRARNLLKTYDYNPSTIKTEAAKLHAKLTTWRKTTGLEWPDNWREMGKKSKAKEDIQCRSTKRKRGRN